MDKAKLISGLTTLHSYLPGAWLIPCDGNKRPAGHHLGSGERHITPDDLRKALKSGKLELPCWLDPKTKEQTVIKNVADNVQGYKLLTGKTFSYRCQQVALVAVDLDPRDGGDSALNELNKILDGDDLPKTIAWSSGRPRRCTYLFYVPEAQSESLNSKVSIGDLELIAGWPGVVIPPSAHPETSGYEFLPDCNFEQVQVAELPQKLLVKLVKNTQKYKSLDDIPIPVANNIPLIECCSREVRNLVAAGVPENSGHNDAAIRVALELVAVERYLSSIGQSFDQCADDLFRDFLLSSEVKETPRSLERLEWAHKKNYIEPSCKPEGVNNCIRGWYWTNILKNSLPKTKQGRITLLTPQVKEDVWLELEKIYASNSSIKETESRLQLLGNKYELDQRQVDRLYRKVQGEIDQVIEDEISQKDFLDYIKIRSTGLDIGNILPPRLAEDIRLNAKSKYHPVRALSYLWPAVATLVGAKVKVWANRPSNWSSDLVFYCVDIGRKGSGKTPAGKDILNYIFEKDKEARRAWEEDEAHLAQLRAAWEGFSSTEKTHHEDDPAVNPALYEQQMAPERKYKFDSPTVPAVVKFLGLQPKWHSGLLYNDELASLFAGFNQFTKGGNDRQFWLEFFNGRSWKTLERVTDTPGTCRRLNGQMMQVVGGMQLDAFKKYLALSTSQDGLTDRFLISDPPEIAPPTELPKIGTGASQVLERIYQTIESIDLQLDGDGEPIPAVLDWEPDAYSYWEQCYLGLSDLSYRLRKENHDFAGYCSKLITYFPRFAGALSLIWQAEATEEGQRMIPENIPLHIAKRTWELIQYHACQYLAIQHTGDTTREPLLSEVWGVVEAEGSITPRTIVQRFGSRKLNGKKIGTKEAIAMLHQLNDSGFGELEKVRTSVKLKYKAPAEELIKQNIFQLKPASTTPGLADLVRIFNVDGVPDDTAGVVGIINDNGTYVVATEFGEVTTIPANLHIQN